MNAALRLDRSLSPRPRLSAFGDAQFEMKAQFTMEDVEDEEDESLEALRLVEQREQLEAVEEFTNTVNKEDLFYWTRDPSRTAEDFESNPIPKRCTSFLGICILRLAS